MILQNFSYCNVFFLHINSIQDKFFYFICKCFVYPTIQLDILFSLTQ